ncbi:hypothetical protein N7466_006081 [Penicillium verhagenii]|uniref:uncharacterized protein n=1 Tax=Penicillium verhagenii TaxID=1562060 RepID=UPI002545A59F|nr:uncharacterized protein N7466_006081 [Penicillium verhagenii]KAJ5930588.1 hypothetical protein N7466_006081 [Penicillium verhagenii]
MYKSNYDIYKCDSLDSRRSPPPPSDELLSPLAELYPHVAAMQPQYNPNNCAFTGYRHIDYWAAAYSTQPTDEATMFSRRGSEQPPCRRFVSKLRRLLNRDDLKHRRRSGATARTTLS